MAYSTGMVVLSKAITETAPCPVSTHMRTENVQDRIDELEERVEVLESLFSDRALGKERSHKQRKANDARDIVNVGDVYTKVIQNVEPQSHGKPDQGVTRIETGIVTFVEPGEFDVGYGDTVKLKITDVKESAAEAIAIEKIEDSG